MKSCIVAAIDFSEVTPIVMEQAAKETKLRPGAKLHLMHVIPPPAVPVGVIAAPSGLDLTSEIETAREELMRVGRAANIEGVEMFGHVRIGSAPEEIIALANDVEADLIVVGASHKGLVMRALVGSTTEPILHRAPCSVLVARPYDVPEVEPPRADQDDDVHKRHHPQAHVYAEPVDRLGHENESFRFTIE